VPGPACGGPDDGGHTQQTAFTSLLEDSAEDLYENAPCGYLSTLLDGQIAKVNTTLLTWLGYTRDQLVGRRYFSDLLTVGGRLYHETHFAPLLSMQGEIGGVALELQAADGSRLPVLVTSAVKTSAAGEPLLIRTTIFDARDRRAYERRAGPQRPWSSSLAPPCCGAADGGSKCTSTCSKPFLRCALACLEYVRRSPVVRMTLSVKGVSSDLGCMLLTRTTLISAQSRTAVALM
jgi:PAS domain S-box-containing protein